MSNKPFPFVFSQHCMPSSFLFLSRWQRVATFIGQLVLMVLMVNFIAVILRVVLSHGPFHFRTLNLTLMNWAILHDFWQWQANLLIWTRPWHHGNQNGAVIILVGLGTVCYVSLALWTAWPYHKDLWASPLTLDKKE